MNLPDMPIFRKMEASTSQLSHTTKTGQLKDLISIYQKNRNPEPAETVEDLIKNQEQADMLHTESKTQIACVNWFHLQYRTEPALCYHFFSVPNGGLRRLITAQIMKAEGAKPGVSDLLLMVPNGKYNFLAIEMKTAKGRQSDNQKNFQKQVERLNYGKYVICRTIDEFRREIESYLASTPYGKKVS